MQFFSPTELRVKGSPPHYHRSQMFEAAGAILANEATNFSSIQSYDIFLSHSTLDASIIYGLKRSLEEAGFSSYVYWLDDAAQQSKVTPETASRLKERMKTCKGLLYATSDNAENSRWMPWELGYFDGVREKVAICPITSDSNFNGREYLGLYPVMEKDFWLHKDGKLYKRLRPWLDE